MKIVLIGPDSVFKGGIAQYNHHLADTLTKKGHTLRFIGFRAMYPALLFPSGRGNRTASDTDNAENFSVERILHWASPLSWIRAGRRITSFAPDLLILPWWTWHWGPYFRMLLALIGNTPVRIIAHNVKAHETSTITRMLTDVTRNSILSRADGIIVQSQEEKETLTRSAAISCPVRVHHHPIYPQFSSDIPTHIARNRLDLPRTGRIVLFFGISRRYKGPDMFAEAIAATEPNAVTGIIAGEIWSATLRKELTAIADRTPNLRIMERYLNDSEASLLFSAADAIILPYRSVTGSGVAMAAVGAKKPVICSDLPIFMEIFPPSARFTFPAGDTAALIETMHQFLSADKLNCTAVFDTIAGINGWDVLVDSLTERWGYDKEDTDT